jgi:hypothetical protein
MHALPFKCHSCGVTKDYFDDFYAGCPTCRDCLRRAATEWRLTHLPPLPSRRI